WILLTSTSNLTSARARLSQYRLHPCNVLADLRKLIRLGRLAGGARHAQIELFAAQLEQVLAERSRRLLAQILSLHVGTFMFETSCPVLALDERRRHRELRGGEPEGLPRDLLAHALDLEQHLAGQHSGDPVFDVALAAAHPHFERLLRDRNIREHPDPDAATALDVPRDGATRRLDLAGGHAAAIGRLQAVFAERDGIAALRAACDPALELFAELAPLRLHHV